MNNRYAGMVETDVRDHPGEMRCAFSDPLRNVSGPSFAGCAHCEYQVGINYQVLGADVVSDGAGIFPERLKCGKL